MGWVSSSVVGSSRVWCSSSLHNTRYLYMAGGRHGPVVRMRTRRTIAVVGVASQSVCSIPYRRPPGMVSAPMDKAPDDTRRRRAAATRAATADAGMRATPPSGSL